MIKFIILYNNNIIVRKNKRFEKMKFYIGFCLIIIITVMAYFYIKSQRILTQALSTNGYIKANTVEVDVQGDTALVKLTGDCFEFSFYTTSQQVESIISGLTKQIAFRPNTHDIMQSILERYGIRPIIVKIKKLEEQTYFADMTLQRGFSYMTIDIRPSDAVAIAVRMDAPIYVNESLIDKTC